MPGEARERLSERAYTTLEPGNPLGRLEEALALSLELAPLEKRLRQAYKEGLIRAEYLGEQIEQAEVAEIVSGDEAARLRDYHDKVFALLAVDDFAPDELGRSGTVDATQVDEPPPPRKAAKRKAPPRKKVSGKTRSKATAGD